MTTYRVGEAGATVFNEKGEPLARLRPGYVVVEGTLDTAKQRLQAAAKRFRDYSDKKLRSEEDK
jgi:hypothetical protein